MNSNEEIIPSYVLDWINKKLDEFGKRLDKYDEFLSSYTTPAISYHEQPSWPVATVVGQPRPPPDPPNGHPELYHHQFKPYTAPPPSYTYTDSYAMLRSPYAEPLHPPPPYVPPRQAYSYHEQPCWPVAAAVPQEPYTYTDSYAPLQNSYAGHHPWQQDHNYSHEQPPGSCHEQPPDWLPPPMQRSPPTGSIPTYTALAISPAVTTPTRSCPEQPADELQPLLRPTSLCRSTIVPMASDAAIPPLAYCVLNEEEEEAEFHVPKVIDEARDYAEPVVETADKIGKAPKKSCDAFVTHLKEEEEQLFSGSKADSRASRRVVQEEEEKLILQKIPLQKMMVEIMAKCGLKNMSNDVERCLSLCEEERMRGILSNVIRLSKQRVDVEKSRQKTVITSDVRQQIMAINSKAREDWEQVFDPGGFLDAHRASWFPP